MANIHERAEVITENNFPSGRRDRLLGLRVRGAGIGGKQSRGTEPQRTRTLASRAAGVWFRFEVHPRRIRGMANGRGRRGFVRLFHRRPEHWKLADCIAIVSASHKKTGSTEGHALAPTSPLQAARVADAPRRLDLCRRAILERDFEAFASVVELDSDMMHSVMMTSNSRPALLETGFAACDERGASWRERGTPRLLHRGRGTECACHLSESEARTVDRRLREIDGVMDVLVARVGGAAKIVNGDS
jgi:diphosphomevalonate decarboxylase